MDPTPTRRPGQHGPRLERQRVIRGVARRFGIDEAYVITDLVARGESRTSERHRRAEAARQRDLHTYVIYSDYLVNGLPQSDPGGYRFPQVPIPDELRDRPQRARRVRHSPGDLARWAYEFRHGRMSWEEVTLAEARRAEQSRISATRLATQTQDALATALETGDDVEVGYQRARLESIRSRISPKSAFDTAYENAEAAIRQAVQRRRYIWELAEKHHLGR